MRKPKKPKKRPRLHALLWLQIVFYYFVYHGELNPDWATKPPNSPNTVNSGSRWNWGRERCHCWARAMRHWRILGCLKESGGMNWKKRQRVCVHVKIMSVLCVSGKSKIHCSGEWRSKKWMESMTEIAFCHFETLNIAATVEKSDVLAMV